MVSGRRSRPAAPGVEDDVLVLVAGGEIGHQGHLRDDVESEDISVEGRRPRNVGHAQLYVADTGLYVECA
jgi:hypothetical protein